MNGRNEKVYCGSGKTQTDRWIKATINPDKLLEHIQEYSGSRFVKININILPEANRFGKDVEITVDTWQPGQKTKQNNDDVPF